MDLLTETIDVGQHRQLLTIILSSVCVGGALCFLLSTSCDCVGWYSPGTLLKGGSIYP